ncbi:hypothetical protein [Rufibacter psychrotolerans]|uniref:hypothetical protein n=1 Tax=Rufibacter psychrotolerans TaxID=2812556 RepID=UPI00196844F3|nr:hypothetical protein [Rufibacter sp. SYSU D00308]
MKTFVLALALSFASAGVSFADNTPPATNLSRQIANALRLNEAEYLKIRKLELARLAELTSSATDAKMVNEKLAVTLLEALSVEQQEAYKTFVKLSSGPQHEAVLK